MPILSHVKWPLMICLALGLTGCGNSVFDGLKTVWTPRHRDDLRVITFDVPALASPECQSVLLQALKGVKGIEVTPDVEARKLQVSYQSRVLEAKNIEYSITAAGFDVNDSPGDPAAKQKLPAPCR